MSEQEKFNFGAKLASVDGNKSEGESVSRRFTPVMAVSTGSEWHEVPQALFLSWSDARQRSYCAIRDEDALLSAESDAWIVFYGRRAERYRAG